MAFFLFPGQGSQTPGMGKDFYAQSPEAKNVLDRAEAVLGPGLLDKLFSGSADELKDTRNAQPALVAVGIAIAAHLRAHGVTPSGCAGHSVGEIAALAVAGTLALDDALHLTRARARLMAEGVPEGGMSAVTGLEAGAIAEHLPPDVAVANYNGPQQTIISGSIAGLEQAEASLKTAGARRIVRLPVSGPFHSPFMRQASERFREELQDVRFNKPEIRFISSVTGLEEGDPGRIRELLGTQLTAPVKWTQVMQRIAGVDAIEVGPGKVLQGIARRAKEGPAVTPAGSVEEAAALAAT